MLVVMKFVEFAVLIFLILKPSYCAPAEDLVTHLPGFSGPISFKQYSGYLTASTYKHFHYW